MTRKYTVKVKNLQENKSRDVTVKDNNPMVAHKRVYMSISSSEEIEKMVDEKGHTVFSLRKGFTTTK